MKKTCCLLSLLMLTACGDANQAQPSSASHTQQNHTADAAIASAVLNMPQSQDILQSSKQAMLNINASDIAAAEQQHFSSQPPLSDLDASALAFQAASDTHLPKLPESCERYYQRVTACFSQQRDAAALLAMNQEQRAELTHHHPDETTCQALNRSFDRVAHNLACE